MVVAVVLLLLLSFDVAAAAAAATWLMLLHSNNLHCLLMALCYFKFKFKQNQIRHTISFFLPIRQEQQPLAASISNLKNGGLNVSTSSLHACGMPLQFSILCCILSTNTIDFICFFFALLMFYIISHYFSN